MYVDPVIGIMCGCRYGASQILLGGCKHMHGLTILQRICNAMSFMMVQLAQVRVQPALGEVA
jgi:hypothetical protein